MTSRSRLEPSTLQLWKAPWRRCLLSAARTCARRLSTRKPRSAPRPTRTARWPRPSIQPVQQVAVLGGPLQPSDATTRTDASGVCALPSFQVCSRTSPWASASAKRGHRGQNASRPGRRSARLPTRAAVLPDSGSLELAPRGSSVDRDLARNVNKHSSDHRPDQGRNRLCIKGKARQVDIMIPLIVSSSKGPNMSSVDFGYRR
jgi:hypothetical protein